MDLKKTEDLIIPQSKQVIYKKIFLKDTSISIKYDKIKLNEHQEINLSEFFRNKFDKSYENLPINIKSENDEIRFNFNEDGVTVKCKFPAYRSFRDFHAWISSIAEYCDILKVKYFQQITIEKFNELPFSFGKTATSCFEVLNQILSKNLMIHFTEPDTELEVVSNEQELVFSTYEGFIFNVVYGYKRKEISDLYALILKINAKYKQPIPVANLNDTLINLNKRLFDVFNWCLSDNIKEQMSN